MATKERTKEILGELGKSVYEFREDDAVKWAKAALKEGVDPFQAALEGLAQGMIETGEAYNRKEYFVPEMLMAADALYAGLGVLQPAIKASGRKAKVAGSIILGVVEGDVHDIGKNLLKVMFDVAGWTIYDLGKDVPIDKFVEEQLKTNADIVGLSSFMTTSMLAMPVIIEKIHAKNPRARIMVGGTPLNPVAAEKYGADGYAKSAGTAVDEAMRLLEMLQKEELGQAL
ncbi:MAG: cobalamin B12-binding domain-containing protein [Chloroflexi bacterium]|nr:cobalamin B12-binding domain-containing protein [Chloroflexota bacterium]